MQTIAYDATLKRPGCAIIQADMEATVNVSEHFSTEDWLLAPTPDMKLYPVTDEQLEQLKVITRVNRSIP